MKLQIIKASLGYDGSGNLKEGLILQKQYDCLLLGGSQNITVDGIESVRFYLNSKQVPDGDIRLCFPKSDRNTQNRRLDAEDELAFQITVVNPLLQGGGLQLEFCFKEATNESGTPVVTRPRRFKFWIHYAFRWFQRPQVLNEITERKVYPWKISQHSTSLCGIACIFYFLIKDDPDTYERLALRLHQYGYAHHNNFLILPNAYLCRIDPEKNHQYPRNMAYVDWITLASVRNVESRLGYQGRASQVASAINWPHILTKLGRNFLGYQNTHFKLFSPIKTYIRDYLKDNIKLKILVEEVDRYYQQGSKIILLVDSDMLYNHSHYHLKNFIQYHWVAYEGGLRMVDQKGEPTSDYASVRTICFDIFSWGEEIKHSRTSKGISRNAFIRNYYGYIRIS